MTVTTASPTGTRVLQVHTRYRQAGGEERVVDAERVLLEGAGIGVQQVIFDNADLRESHSLSSDLALAASSVWSRQSLRVVERAIGRWRPDVMHVHNTFAAASPAIYYAARRAGVRVVQTLHNYRLVCPVATTFRDGHQCTDCVGRPVPWPSVVHACVRDSHAQSAVVATMLATHRALGTYRKRVDQYVALSRFQRELVINGGLPPDRVTVIPNFLEPDPGVAGGHRGGIVYVGRLSVEKGINPMLAAAKTAPGVLRVAGTGPLHPLVERAAAEGDVTALGPLSGDAVSGELGSAVALIVPSLWFEGFPMVVLEAYALGTPVIASRIGSLAEIVEDGITGLLVEPNDPDALAQAMRWAIAHPARMRDLGAAARERYEGGYRGARHLELLLEAYRMNHRARADDG